MDGWMDLLVGCHRSRDCSMAQTLPNPRVAQEGGSFLLETKQNIQQ